MSDDETEEFAAIVALDLTVLETAQAVAATHNVEWTEQQANWVVWERTAMPFCGMGHMLQQVKAEAIYFAEHGQFSEYDPLGDVK